jgi:SAM-dependent methyltransferase
MSLTHADFYSKHNISPVSQDIGILGKHYQRRESLYLSLGLVPSFMRGRTILEFGPGSGHNALYTASLSPQKYELVDGNFRGVQETRDRLASFTDSQITVHHALFDMFTTDSKFDTVWAEGCLPHQSRPLPLLTHVASFVAGGGFLCVSTNNGISYLSETIRRLFRDRFFDALGDVHEQARKLTPYIQPHLQHLRGMSRPVEDWILDSIVQPMRDRRLLSIPDVVSCLDREFDVYGSSPRFLTDWRWYKEIIGDDRRFNELALDNYYKNNLNLLDYRFDFPEHSRAYGEKLEALGSRSWDLMCEIEHGNETIWKEFFDLMDELCSHIDGQAPITVGAIRESCALLQNPNPDMDLSQFPQWWGRGQQYLSLIRKKC